MLQVVMWICILFILMQKEKQILGGVAANALTTAEEGAGDFSYYYIVYPATTYVNSSWAASSKVGLPTVPCSGDKSAEIASIGWGKGSTCTTGLVR